MEGRQHHLVVMMIVVSVIASLPQKADSTITGQNISDADKAALISDYFLQHEFESHYVYESAMAANDLVQHISSGNLSSTTPEFMNAMASYVLVSLPDFLRNSIVQDVVEVLVDELGIAFQRTNLIFNTSIPFSNNDMQQIMSEFNYVGALTRSITVAKPLIEQYRQENDSTVFIILLNKAIEVSAYAISTPTFQTVMDIVIDELSQGFLKSGLPERIALEGTDFLNDYNNTASIVETILKSSNIERLISRSYTVSKPVLDSLYDGDTLFLYVTLMTAAGSTTDTSQQNQGSKFLFKLFEAEFIKTYKNVLSKGDAAALIGDPVGTYVTVVEQMDIPTKIMPMLGSVSARALMPYNSTAEEDKINEDCYEDYIDFLDAAKDKKDWALKMFDAYGKINSGIYQGNFNFLGSMDQCLEVRSDIKANEMLGNTRRTSQRYPRSVGSRFCRAILPTNSTFKGVPLRITWGVCVPNTCTGSDVYGLLKLDAFENATMMVDSVECLMESDITQDLSAIIALIVLGSIIVLILCGTLYVSLETRGVFSDTTESVTGETTPNILACKKKENGTEKYEDLKAVKVGSGNIVKTNESNLPEKYIPRTESDNHTICITHQQAEEQPNDVSNGESSTRDVLPNPESIVKQPSKTKEGVLIKIIKAFALQINVPKVLTGDCSPNTISCLHGIRFFTITWVILIHSYFHGLTRNAKDTWPLVNVLEYSKLTENFAFHGVMASNSAVDTFFMMSGMLLTYTQMKNVMRLKAKLTGPNIGRYVFRYFFHRIWRMSPAYVIVLLVYATLVPYFISGPLTPATLQSVENCKESWWTNMLYINNLVNVDKQCMAWSWYMANDMQFYTVTIVLLLLMAVKLPLGIIVSVMLMLVGMATAAWKQYIFNGNMLTRLTESDAYFRNVYITPWCRVSAYIVGLLFGIFMQRRPRKAFSKMIGFAGWTSATAVALTLKYSPYSQNREGGVRWTRWQNAFYESFDRPVWALCVCWVVFACHNHMGGVVHSILSWKGFIPLSRLTFPCYLIHPVIMLVHGFSRRALFYMTDLSMIYLFLGHTTMSFMAAFVLSIACESPFIALEKLLM